MSRRMFYSEMLDHPVTHHPFAFKLWAGLILLADDSGATCVELNYLFRRIYSPLRYPGKKNLTVTLEEFSKNQMVTFYEFNGLKYAKINNWSKYQHLKRPRASTRASRSEVKGSEMKGTTTEQNAVEEFPKPDLKIAEILNFEGLFGEQKSIEIAQRTGITESDLKDWRGYEKEKGTRLMKFNMKNFRNPKDIPKEVEGNDGKIDSKEFAKKFMKKQKEEEDAERKRNKRNIR